MARLLGPDLASRRVVGSDPAGGTVTFAGRTATVWADSAATVLADIATYDGTLTPGAAIAGSKALLDNLSRLPLFWFPASGADVLYVTVPGMAGVRQINADYDSRLDTAFPDPSALLAPTQRMPQYVPAASVVASAGWGGSSGINTTDTTDFVAGTSAASITSLGAGGTWRISKGSLILDTTGMQLRLRLKVDNLSHLASGGVTFVAANESGYTNSYTWQAWGLAAGSDLLTAGDWVTVTLNFASAVTAGSPTRTGITDIKATFNDANDGTTTTMRLQTNMVELIAEPSYLANGLVSICFDDLWDSGFTYGKAKMDSLAIPAQGTIHAIGDLWDTAGRLTRAQALAAQEQGWEIAAHASTDATHTLSYTGLTSAQLDADLRAQKAALRAYGFTGADGTAYPLGQYGRTTDNVSTTSITRKYFAWARTTAAGSTGTRETFPPGDPYRLRAISSISTFSGGYAPTSITATTTGDLDKTKASKGWLILAFHKIVTGSPASTAEVAQSDFDAIIDKVVSNGMACLPIGAALRHLG